MLKTDPKPVAPKAKDASLTQVVSGSATAYWLELAAYPPGDTRSLWLFVDNAWRHLDNPTPNIEASVQNAFAYPDRFETLVWYDNDVIVGLVVRSR